MIAGQDPDCTRTVVVGFTPMQADRLLESAGVQDYADVLVVLNLHDPCLADSVRAAGFQCISLDDYCHRPDDRLLLGVLRPGSKKKVIEDYLRRFPRAEESFRPAVHAFTSVSRTAKLGCGTFIEPGVVVAPHASIGNFVSINRNVSVGHHTRIGAWSMINPGVDISGTCEIGESVSIGIGVSVFDGLQIGEGSVIGGGSVVTKDVPAGVLAYGNPCKTVRAL